MIHYILQVSPSYNTSASYNRVRLFKKGLEELCIKVDIHLLLIKNKNVLQKLFFLVSGYLKVLLWILKVSKKDVVIVYGETYFTKLYPLIRKRTYFVIERTEYPDYLINGNISSTGYNNSRKNLEAIQYASSLITCSSYLKNFYSQYIDDIFVAPLIVDVNEINYVGTRKPEMPHNYVAYCGSFGNNKDGLPILIEAFSYIVQQLPGLKLVLIGSGPQNEVDSLKDDIRNLNLENEVLFTGPLPHSEVVDWLKYATILALSRPNNKQAEGGIPSKVGEYLATGVPCVITNVGDLPMYLKDGFDCFISEPNSATEFANKMAECLQSDMKAIGNNAKQTVMRFNYDVQAKALYEHLIEVACI